MSIGTNLLGNSSLIMSVYITLMLPIPGNALADRDGQYVKLTGQGSLTKRMVVNATSVSVIAAMYRNTSGTIDTFVNLRPTAVLL